MKRLCLLVGLCLAIAAQAEDDLAWKSRLLGETHGLRGDSPFAAGLPLTAFGRNRARLEEEVRGRVGPLALLATASAAAQAGSRLDSRVTVNELFADLGLGGERFSVGKKILAADVGYAFRPLDVLQRENRLQLLPPALEGIPQASWDNYSADAAWSLIVANPGHGRRGLAREDGSLALRGYRRVGATDFHGVWRQSARYGSELGAAFASVPDAAWELHGSFLQQTRGERRQPLAEGAPVAALLSPDAALAEVALDHPRKALLGATWTDESGLSVMGELWWDGSAPRAEDWRRLAANAARRNALLALPGVPAAAVAGATASSLALFQSGNLTRRGRFLRLAWSDPADSTWSASADLLQSAEDGGWNLTLGVGWQADKLRVDAGVRYYGGPAQSAWRLFPERGVLFAGASLAF